MELGLKGKKAIITGATRGIGRAVAEHLAREKVDIGFCARDEEQVRDTAAALEDLGVKAVGRAVNVRDKDQYEAWLAEAAEALGGVDVFVASVSGGGGMDSERNWWRNFEIDVLHTVRGCETLTPHLEKSEAGSVVIIASTNAVEFFAAPMGYNAMKAALINYGSQLAQFVGGKGIRVNSVCPGPVYFEGGAWEMIEGTNPKFYESTQRKFPGKRFVTPEEVARTVTFIASPAASAITGVNLVVDNGYTKRVQY